MITAIVASIMFLIFYVRTSESINLVILCPAIIVSAVLVLNSYFMYLGQFQTGYFTLMKVITIIAGIFPVLALFFFGMANGGSPSQVLRELLAAPAILVKDPIQAIVFGFPLFSAATAITSFFIDHSNYQA